MNGAVPAPDAGKEQRLTFGELRGRMPIADGFADDNLLICGADRLPVCQFKRHGAPASMVGGCVFWFAPSARGSYIFYVAQTGARVHIGAETRCNIDVRLWSSAVLSVGAQTTMNNCRIVIDNSDVQIGRDCMFSDEVLLQSADQHGIVNVATGAFLNQHRRHIRIGEHVWLGRRSIVMPDTEIGSGSIIGTGSTVTKDIGAFSVAVGVPARVVREGTSWTRLPMRASPRETQFFARAKPTLDASDPGRSETND